MKTIRSVVLFASLVVAAAAIAQPPASEKPAQPAPTTPAKPAEPAKQPDATKPAAPADAAKPVPAESKMVFVKMSTSMGDIIIQLDGEKAPVSTANFLSYVDKNFYNGTIFHRVISNFMIQGGGFTPDMQQKPTDKPIKNEWQNGLKNVRGSIAMARTSNPDSATSQFFINVQNNSGLDQANGGAAYAVFGKVVAGMDVVDAIRAVKTTTKPPHADVPAEPVTITTVTRLTSQQAEEAIKAAATPKK